MNQKPTRGGVKMAMPMFSRNQFQWETLFPGSTGKIAFIFYGETGNI
jgi:hypothetical protein